MFLRFFTELRRAGIPVTLKEYLVLMEGLDRGVIDRSVEDFYFLSRASLVKDEKNLDRFDQVFGRVFKGLEQTGGQNPVELPAEWLRKLSDQFLTPEEMAQIQAMGGFEALMQALAERLREQKARHQGGARMIGTAGTSPFGAEGFNPEGVRIGQDSSRHGRAVKVWDRREYRDLDDSVELGTRNIKVALRRLRRWVREGHAEELDLDATIRGAAEKGYLDIRMRPERRNKVSVLVFFDIGGSMDAHVQVCEALFSAARSEFKTLDFFYFHNCLYERVWKDNRRRRTEQLDTWDLLHRFPREYKVIFVGDATMSPYEVTYPGGSVEHWNAEPGAAWLERVGAAFPHLVWLNPSAERHWDYNPSVGLIRRLVGERMFPLTLAGLDQAMKTLAR